MSETVQVPTRVGPIRTVGDLVSAFDTHIDDVLTGKMTDAQARNVIKARNGQLKAAELQLQYARIFKGRAPDPMMPLLTPAPSESRLTPEEEAELRRLQEKSRG